MAVHNATRTQITEPIRQKKPLAIQMRNFSFIYGSDKAKRVVLDKINLQIPQGGRILITGRSGAGKSTLGYALSGLIPHKIQGLMRGTIEILGKEAGQYSLLELSAKIGLVLQNPDEQLVSFTVFDELAFGPENLGIEPAEIRQRIKTIAEQLKISHLLERNIHHLSGGEKQRVVIGAALSLSPEILIFD